MFLRAQVLQWLGFVQESVPCRPASASSPKGHPIFRQSTTGISSRLSHFVPALHPWHLLAAPSRSEYPQESTVQCRVESRWGPSFSFFPFLGFFFFSCNSFYTELQLQSLELTSCVRSRVSLCCTENTPFRYSLFTHQLEELRLAI